MNKLVVPILLGLGVLANLGREVFFAKYLGISQEMEVFRLAYSIPNMLGQSLAPAFIGAMMPLLVQESMLGKHHENLFIQRMLRLNIFGSLIVALIGVLFSDYQASILAPGYVGVIHENLVSNIRITWLFFLGLSLSFGLRTVMNMYGVFWVGVSASLVNGLVFILGCFGYLFFDDSGLSAYTLSFMSVLAGVLVLFLHCFNRKDLVFRVFSRIDKNSGETWLPDKIIILILGTVIICHVLRTVPRFMDRAFATDLSVGWVASIEYSYNLLSVPSLLLATSFVVVVYPSFVKAVEKKASIRKYVLLMLGAVALGAVLGFLGYVFSMDIVTLVYMRGLFGVDAVIQVASIYKWHSLSLAPLVAGSIVVQAAIGWRCYKLLFVSALLMIVVKYVALKFLMVEYAVEGLAMSSIISEVFMALFLGVSLVVYRGYKSV